MTGADVCIKRNNPPGCVTSFISICQNWAERFLVNNVRKQYIVLQQEILVKLLRPPGLYGGGRSRKWDILIKRTSIFLLLFSLKATIHPTHTVYHTVYTRPTRVSFTTCTIQYPAAVSLPPSQPDVVEWNERCMTITWKAPIDDGGMKITAYTVEAR